MLIEPTITLVPLEFSGYIWLDTKIVIKKKFDVHDPDITHKYEMPGIHACKHRLDACFPTALGRQPTFSDTSVPKIYIVLYPLQD